MRNGKIIINVPSVDGCLKIGDCIMSYQVESVEITSRCPCSCPGCYYKIKDNEMCLDDFKTVVDNSPKSIERLQLSGGEPFLHKDLLNMCKYASRHLVKPYIFTSGVLYKEKLVKKLKPYISGIKITVKYPSKEKENKFKGLPFAFSEEMRLFTLCNALNIPLFIHWVVDKNNLSYYSAVINLSKKFNAKLEILKFLPFNPELKNIVLSDEQFKKLRIYPDGACPSGILRFNVKVDFSVTPCIYISKSFGNILTDNFNKIRDNMYKWRVGFDRANYCIAERLLRGD